MNYQNHLGVVALSEGERDAGVCMHERKLALATKIRGLCGCKRRIEIMIHYKKQIRIFEEFIIVLNRRMREYI